MQIKSPQDLSTLYATNQAPAKPPQENKDRMQTPASTDKAATVSISREAMQKQAEAQRLQATSEAERPRQQEAQKPAPPPAKNLATTQRIDLVA